VLDTLTPFSRGLHVVGIPSSFCIKALCLFRSSRQQPEARNGDLLYGRGCFFWWAKLVSIAANTVPPDFRIFSQFDLNQIGSTSVTFWYVHHLLPDNLVDL
jgi:hypothetical protein